MLNLIKLCKYSHETNNIWEAWGLFYERKKKKETKYTLDFNIMDIPMKMKFKNLLFNCLCSLEKYFYNYLNMYSFFIRDTKNLRVCSILNFCHKARPKTVSKAQIKNRVGSVSANFAPFPFVIFKCFLYIVSDSFEFYHEKLLWYWNISKNGCFKIKVSSKINHTKTSDTEYW